MTTSAAYEQLRQRALRRGKPVPQPPPDQAPISARPGLTQAAAEILDRCWQSYSDELMRLEQTPVIDLKRSLADLRRNSQHAFAIARLAIEEQIRIHEEAHQQRILEIKIEAHHKYLEQFAKQQREQHAAAPSSAARTPQHDYACMYRADKPLTKEQKALFLCCTRCGPDIFRCNHPDFADTPEPSPAQYCTVYSPSKNKDVALCRRCELRTP